MYYQVKIYAYQVPWMLVQLYIFFKLFMLSLYRLGAWQFLADMPFGSVSSETLWKLFWALQGDVTKLDSVESLQREDSIWDNWREALESMYTQTTAAPLWNLSHF